ncbi:MATE family efflux transporter [Sulfitobacter algicola]|uniref:Multidrug-efflux transporter n=1 Tax=Parasulfitobacter algicola TaxID=2614809 RepID=A0ABX2IVU9_9RHOB|nr:MATE family efflux transporter [Sulfitobacter algicola]NSX54313.1 MATE family efflux transporter [Sulfitobacter algicola]
MAIAKTYPEHARAILILGLPLIGSNLAQFAIHMTDSIMLGWYAVEALAAVTLAGALFFVLFIVGSGFAWAVMPMVAQASEMEDDAQIRRTTRMAMWLSLIYGAVMIMPMWFSGQLFLLIGQDPEIAQLAQDYLRIAGWGILPALLVMVLKSYLSALERIGFMLIATIGAAFLNAGLNYALIFGNFGAPEMGIHGAATASVILQIFSFGVLGLYAAFVMPQHALFQRIWRLDMDAFSGVFRLGWPIGLTNLAESGLFSAASVMMGWIGTIELAAHGIALQFAGAMFMVHLGLSQAATVRAGRAMGRKDQTGLKIGAQVIIMMSILFSVFTIIIFLGVPELLISLFLDADDPDRIAILAVGVGLLAVAAVFQLADGVQVLALGLLRGVQDTRQPMVMAAISYWLVGAPCSYVLAFVIGLDGAGVWLGLVIGLGVAAVLLIIRFWSRHISKAVAV